MLDRIIQAHLERQSSISEMVVTSKVNPILNKLRHVATNMIVVRSALLNPKDQAELDALYTKFEREIGNFMRFLSQVDGRTEGFKKTINPAQRAALERTKQHMLHAFR